VKNLVKRLFLEDFLAHGMQAQNWHHT